jgi:hypothetical protein
MADKQRRRQINAVGGADMKVATLHLRRRSRRYGVVHGADVGMAAQTSMGAESCGPILRLESRSPGFAAPGYCTCSPFR